MIRTFLNADDGAGTGGAPTPPVESEKKFSQDDLNGFLAKETAKTQEKILKELGITDVKSAKEGLAELKRIQDSQKDEAQKLAERNKELEDAASEVKKKADMLEAKITAIDKGVDKDKAEKVISLALNGGYTGETMADKIDAVLTDFPEFFKTASEPATAQKPKDFGSKTGGTAVTEIDKLNEIIKKNM